MAVSALVAVALGGCAGHSADAGRTVAAFHAAVADRDGAAACGLLAPSAAHALESDAGEPCADAITAGGVGDELRARAGGRPGEAHVAGLQAQVRTGSDVVFLAASGGRWVITAVGCDARPARPYDCEVET